MGDESPNGLRIAELLADYGESEQTARDAMEARLMAAIARVESTVAGTRTDLNNYERAHGDEHAAIRKTSDEAHARFDTFIRGTEIAAARQDGALGVLRFVADLAGRNWKAIAAVATGVAALTGAVHISLGVAP